MEKWRLIDMGLADPIAAQTFYEAVALAVDKGLSPSTVLLVQPSSPYVCIGYHQELEREVDVEYCHSSGLPIIRRSQGGGAVYLDSNQIFYQVVVRGESDIVPLGVERLFQTFLDVTVHVYQRLGLPAEFKAVNDVVVNCRKISGNGAGSFGENTTILVGNVILDLDFESMARVLRVPNEKFRDKTVKSMKEWVTSLRKELGFIPSAEEVKRLIIEGYDQVLGVCLVKSGSTEVEKKIWEKEVVPRHLSREWLYMTDLRREELAAGRRVTIAGDVRVVEVDHKAKKLIRVRAELKGTKIREIVISGDFFMVPEEALTELEHDLKDTPLEREKILRKVREFHERTEVQIPGLAQEDFADAIMKLRKSAEV